MNTKNLIKKSVAKNPIQREKGALIFNRVFEIIQQGIIKDNSFHLENFGKFEVHHREMKTEINYKTKTEILIPPKDKVKFTPLFLLKKSKRMSRLILIKNISEEFSISESAASDYIKSIFDTILETLSSGKNVNIAGFGKFIFKHNKVSFSLQEDFLKRLITTSQDLKQ